MPSPILGFDLPYDGQQDAIATINAALLALESAVANPPRARVTHNANQAVANTTVVPLAFNTERYDTDSIHNTVTNNSRLTCNTAGLYLITFSAEFASNAVGLRSIAPRFNGVNTWPSLAELPAVSGGTTKLWGSTVWPLIVGDYVELVAYQSSGGSLNVLSTGNYSPEFGMVKVG